MYMPSLAVSKACKTLSSRQEWHTDKTHVLYHYLYIRFLHSAGGRLFFFGGSSCACTNIGTSQVLWREPRSFLEKAVASDILYHFNSSATLICATQ